MCQVVGVCRACPCPCPCPCPRPLLSGSRIFGGDLGVCAVWGRALGLFPFLGLFWRCGVALLKLQKAPGRQLFLLN